MSNREIVRYRVIEDYRLGRLSRTAAALKLGVSERSITRLAQKIKEKGLGGVRHGNVGRVPWNKISAEIVETYVLKYRETYSKFNFSHALEMMATMDDMSNLNYSKFRKACRERGLGKVKKRRCSKARMARERSGEEGYMWQMDGSPHAWYGKDTWSLIALIDDATSKIPGATFANSETTWACMNVVREAIAKHGAPEFILTDRAGWASLNHKMAGKRVGFTQFVRACEELGITVICTSIPESKGRIERLNRTFQDRIIPELELYKIKSQIDSNRYLKHVFLPAWDGKFTVEPRSETTRYRPVPAGIDLLDVFCIKRIRVVNRDHTVSYDGNSYQIDPAEGKNYHKKEVTLHEYEDGKIEIFYGNVKLQSAALKKQKRRFYRNVS